MGTGILLIDKPGGITSHDVVARVRKAANTRKVGHAGTLDPMATGLVIVGINSSTRLLTYLVGQDKEYVATIRLGQSTTTDDAEGEIVATAPSSALAAVSDESITDEITQLSGDIVQVPSSVSAIKVNGKRAYALVREGHEVTLAGRPVSITAFERLSTRRTDSTIDLDVRVECTSGTYIRALARDLGAALGVGGHLTALRRTRIGPFFLKDARTLDDLEVDRDLIPPTITATRVMPRIDLDQQQAIDLGHGKRLAVSTLAGKNPSLGMPGVGRGPFAAVAPEERLVGLIEVSGSQVKSILNLPTGENADD